jgi:ribulose-5-phosphate 4-epimerase/fuculose-1-phosphate aldolase
MATLSEVEETSRTLLQACRILDRQGVLDSSGHVSFRMGDSDRFVIPARQAPGLATLDSLMVIDGDGNVLEGGGTPPLEWPIHGRIYRARPDVESIMHSHSPMSRLFSITSISLRPVFGIAAPWFHAPVPICRAGGVISSASAGDEVAEILGDGPAVLLRAHGNVVVGPEIEATTVRASTLEQVATSLYQASAIGEVDDLQGEELARWRDETPAGHGKAWAYLAATARTGVEG